MIGESFESLKEFKNACLKKRSYLSPNEILSKIYTVEEIRKIAKEANIHIDQKNDYNRKGFGKRYEFAQYLSENIEPETFGKILSKIDHKFYFKNLMYSKLPKKKQFSSLSRFLKKLYSKGIYLEDNFNHFFNGITQPAGRKPKLESIFISNDNNFISFLFSCTRVLMRPDFQSYDVDSLFLSRIPITAKLFFNLGLIEFSLPNFSEHINLFNANNMLPIRYQNIFQQTSYKIEELLNISGFHSIDLQNFTLYLENIYNAEDMGWRIAPQEVAEFNLKQNVLPLKNILETFTYSLNTEAQKRKEKHPLEKINLYNIFRALKEQSHTHTLVLKIYYGNKKGYFFLSVIYGHSDSDKTPLITIDKNKEIISNLIRNSIIESQNQQVDNPYDLDSIFSEFH